MNQKNIFLFLLKLKKTRFAKKKKRITQFNVGEKI